MIDLTPHITKGWPIERLQRLVRYMDDGLTYTQIAESLHTSRGAIAGKCAKMGIRRPVKTADQTLNSFAEALAECGDIAQAAWAAGVSFGHGQDLFTKLRKDLGPQAV